MRLIFVLCLLVQSALAQSAKLELWFTTFNSTDPGTPQLPPPGAPWKPAMWTMGIINTIDSTPQDVRRLAKICSEGGELKDGIQPKTLAYLRAVGRTDIFPGEKVPPHTLLIADFEGQSNEYAVMLCGNIRKQTKQYTQYPGFYRDSGVTIDWTRQLREIDFYCIQRGWQHSGTSKLAALAGDYFIVELYLADPKLPNAHTEERFRYWTVMLAATRKQLPKMKILALIQSRYAWPSTDVLTDEDRHRLERLALLCDGVWVWGLRDNRLTDEIGELASDPLHRFAGEEGWARQ